MADESYWLEDECLPEMTFLDYTTDSTMEITSNEGNTSYIQPPELSKHNGKTAGTDQNAKMVDTPDREGQPERWMDERYFPEITLLEVTRDSDLSPAADMSTMEVTQDVPPVDAVKPRRPSSELSGLIVAEPDGPGMMQSEELSSTLTGSVTNTTSSFSEQSKSVQENVKSSLEATRDISVGSVLENTSSSELSGQSMKSQTSPEDTLGILPSNVTRDLSSSSDVSVQSAESQIAPSDVQSATRLKNVTIEIQAKPVETSIAAEANEEELLTGRDTESTGKEPQTTSDLSDSTNLNTTDPSPGARNKTLDLPPSDVNSPKAESVAADQVGADVQSATDTSPDTNQNSSAAESGESCDVQNGNDTHSLQKSCGTSALGETGAATFSLQNTFDSKPNGTITETSSSDSRQNTFDKPSPDRETKDHSQSVPDGLSESLGHQGTDTENHQANTFNLDDTLDLKVVLPETSTPMPSCKDSQFSFQHDTGRAIAAAKKLYGDGPSKPVVQVPPDVPSNLVTNRKTLMQPAAKSHLPPLKAASQLLKYHPTSALPGRCEPATSRLPMTRQRTQTEAVKNPAPSAQGVGLECLKSFFVQMINGLNL